MAARILKNWVEGLPTKEIPGNNKFLRINILAVVILFASISLNGQNLLVNGGFENGHANWGGGGVVNTAQTYEGIHSLFFGSHSSADQLVYNVNTLKECKISAWIYISSAFTGNDWGGININVKTNNWQDITQIAEITPYNSPVGEWFQVINTFNSNTTAIRVTVGMFGGGGWNPSFYIDDVRLFYAPETNDPPVIHQLLLSDTTGTAPFSINGQVLADDGFFGAVVHTLIQTGDGGVIEGKDFNYIFTTGGEYLLKAIVVDDDGATASATQMINIQGDPFHSITIETPTSQAVHYTSNPTVTIGGSRLGGSGNIFWTNTRTFQNGWATSGNQFLIQNIGLKPGRNVIHLQSCTTESRCIIDEITVVYEPSEFSVPQISNLQIEHNELALYEKWECRFDLLSMAENPWFPYDTALPANLNAGSGVTVDAVFSKDDIEKRIPAFYDMDYEIAGEALRLSGQFTWKVRMAFDSPGIWQMKLIAQEQSGCVEFNCPDIIVTNESDNPGFLKVSETDNRYFEFDNGKPFIGMGHGLGVSDNLTEINQKIQSFSSNGINFSRTWLMAESPFSDAWSSWATHHPMENNGYMPPPLYSINQNYKNQDFSLKIAAPAIENQNTPAIFRGFWDVNTIVKPSTTYRVVARVKTTNLTGNGGLLIKVGGWLGQEAVNPGVGQVISNMLKGSNSWVYLYGNYTTGPWESEFPNLYLVLQQVTSGEAYIDMVTIQEAFADGSLSDNILSKHASNVHYYFDPAECRYFDYIVEHSNQEGIYLKIPVLEKDDWILNHIEPLTGLVTQNNGRFDAPSGSKLHRLYQYYWRYLIARWGYATSVHSWELVNEGAPGSYFELMDEMADYFDNHSPYPRLTSTSFWSSWVPEYWAESKADYSDVHAYIMTTGWIDNYIIDGQIYTREQLRNDAAAAVYAYSDYVYNDPQRNKPMILAETDLDQPGNQSPDPLLASDIEGVWLHNFNWGHINHGGATAFIWNNQNIINNNLYYRYRSFTAFMEDIPLNNGLYVPLKRIITNPQLRVWGQQQSTGEAVHFWVQNNNHTWRKVVTTGKPAPVSGIITLQKLKPGEVEIELWDSWGEATSPYLVYNDTVAQDSTLLLTISDLQTDLAVKVWSKSNITQQIINLNQGWQGISSFVIPENASIEVVLNEVLPKLEIIYGVNGVYWPAGEVFTLNQWDNAEGYNIKMKTSGTLNITGIQTPIGEFALPQGWSLMPVVSNCMVGCYSLLGEDINNLILIKEVAGARVFWPSMNIHTLIHLEPGKAYWINLIEETNLLFPDCN